MVRRPLQQTPWLQWRNLQHACHDRRPSDPSVGIDRTCNESEDRALSSRSKGAHLIEAKDAERSRGQVRITQRTDPRPHEANLYDMSADYKFGHGLTATLYFGWAQGGAVIKSIFPTNSNGALGYVELNYKF